MTLYQDVQQWRARLAELLEQGEELAERIDRLEQQNVTLQQKLLQPDPGNGFEALTGLYDDGFHICPPYFGQEREEDCLFCLNFLLHKGKKE